MFWFILIFLQRFSNFFSLIPHIVVVSSHFISFHKFQWQKKESEIMRNTPSPHTSHQNHIFLLFFVLQNVEIYFFSWNKCARKWAIETQRDQVENWIEKVTIFYIHFYCYMEAAITITFFSNLMLHELTVWNNWRYLSFTLSSFLKNVPWKCLAWYSY